MQFSRSWYEVRASCFSYSYSELTSSSRYKSAYARSIIHSILELSRVFAAQCPEAFASTPAEPLELFIKTLSTMLNGFSNKVNSCDIGRLSFGVCTNLVRTVAFRNIYRNFTPSNKMKTVQSCDKYCEMRRCEPS